MLTKHSDFLERIEIFRKKLKSTGVDTEKIKGLSAAALYGYKQRQNWPKGDSLHEWGTQYGLNINWLFFGEGSMLKDESALSSPTRHFNRQGKCVGDLLRVVLAWAGISLEDAAEKTQIDIDVLQNLLDGRFFPNFEQMQALYLDLGINPAYFFDGNEHRMWMPEDLLLRVMWALGEAGMPVSEIVLSDIFGVQLDEAKAFYKEWREFREEGDVRSLPPHWLDNLAKRYSFNPGWIEDLEPPLALLRKSDAEEIKYSSLCAENEALRKQIDDLRQSVAAHAKIIELYSGRDFLTSPIPEEQTAPGMDSVAPFLHGETE